MNKTLNTSLGANLDEDKITPQKVDQVEVSTEETGNKEEAVAPKTKAAKSKVIKPSKKTDTTTKKILVADDERPLAKALELKLKSFGFEVTVAFDGEEALEQIAKIKFDLILSDLVMPKVGGFQVLEKLQSLNNKVPVIITSNLSQEEDQKKAISLGAIKYFVKSNTPISEIIDFIKETLNT